MEKRASAAWLDDTQEDQRIEGLWALAWQLGRT